MMMTKKTQQKHHDDDLGKLWREATDSAKRVYEIDSERHTRGKNNERLKKMVDILILPEDS
jgi:hypothetical protein